MIVLTNETRQSIETAWQSGDIISSNKLNEIYNAILAIANYIEHPDGDDGSTVQLATETYVQDRVNGLINNDASFAKNLTVGQTLTAANVNLAANGRYKVDGTDLTITSETLGINTDSYPQFKIELPIASTAVLGGVKQGNNTNINANGVISVPIATDSIFGVVKTGNNITNSNGEISIPTGTGSIFGVVKTGDNITNTAGVISVQVASTTENGVVKLLAGEDGAIISTSAGITVQKATQSLFGAVKIGTGINIDNGTISIPVSTTSSAGSVQVGSNINVDNGVISVPVSSSTVTGLMTPEQYNKLAGIASGAGVNVQANWTETSSSNPAYILNKPTFGDGLTVTNNTITVQDSIRTTMTDINNTLTAEGGLFTVDRVDSTYHLVKKNSASDTIYYGGTLNAQAIELPSGGLKIWDGEQYLEITAQDIINLQSLRSNP